MGVVYRAEDDAGHRVALKTVRGREAVGRPPNPKLAAAAAEAFRREARLWADLGAHPHVVQAYRVGANDGLLYAAVELVQPADSNAPPEAGRARDQCDHR